jgi:DNA-binding response OmpR family regulator
MSAEIATLRILVVEDHAETRRMLERALREAGHVVVDASDLDSARRRAAEGGFGLVLLDWMLPDGSGTELCREMRKARDTTPILLLTARGGVEDRVLGLDAGADDYLRKPFAVAELLARVRALSRRGPRLLEEVVALGPVEFRLAERKVLVRGREAPITAREMAVLEVLLRRRGHAVARADILQAVWGAEDASAGSLEVLIGRIRRKLGEVGESLLRTHRGYGYSIGEREP